MYFLVTSDLLDVQENTGISIYALDGFCELGPRSAANIHLFNTNNIPTIHNFHNMYSLKIIQLKLDLVMMILNHHPSVLHQMQQKDNNTHI